MASSDTSTEPVIEEKESMLIINEFMSIDKLDAVFEANPNKTVFFDGGAFIRGGIAANIKFLREALTYPYPFWIYPECEVVFVKMNGLFWCSQELKQKISRHLCVESVASQFFHVFDVYQGYEYELFKKLIPLKHQIFRDNVLVTNLLKDFGNLLIHKNKYQASRLLYLAALEFGQQYIRPNQAKQDLMGKACNNLAVSYHRTGDLDSALQWTKKALQFNPQYVKCQDRQKEIEKEQKEKSARIGKNLEK